MSTLKVNKIQPNSSNHISIDGDTTITGSFIHNGVTTLSGTNILSGSTVFKGTTTVEGDLTVGGTLTAQEVRTEFDNASVVFQDGSTKFGDTSDDNHGFTGSLGVQGGIFKVTNGGDDVLIANPNQGTFTIGDTQALGDSAQIIGDSSTIKINNNDRTVLTADANYRIGIGTSSATATLHVDHPSYAVGNNVVNIGVQGNQIAFMNNSGDFMIGDKDGVGDGGYISHDSENFKIFSIGGTEVANFNTNEVKFTRNLLIKAEAGNDATLTLEADPTNIDHSGENDNPSILFKQDGGTENAAVGFNIIDDTNNGTIGGSGNRFWIVNSIADTVGAGGITFGTAQVDGWDNAIARFMIRGDGKGLFGHPNDHFDKVLGSQFEVYDDRTENTTTDYTLAAYGYVDISEYPPTQGAGGIISRLKAVDGATDLGTHAIGMVAGTSSSEILATGDLAFYAGSNMDTSAATGFAGVIHNGSSNWQIGGTASTDTDTGFKLNVVGTSKFDSDVTVVGNLFQSSNTTFSSDGSGVLWSRNTDGASIRFYNTGDSDTNSRLEFNTRDNNNEYFRWTHTDAGGTYESMRLMPVNSGSASKLIISGDVVVSSKLQASGAVIGTSHITGSTFYNGSSILGGSGNTVNNDGSTIAGGRSNTITSLGSGCSVAGSDFIGGGECNKVNALGQAVVVGGCKNLASACYAFVGAGKFNTGSNNAAAVVAGTNNWASSFDTFIGSGRCNVAGQYTSAVVAGKDNQITGNSSYASFIGAGCLNTISGNIGTIAGGKCNHIKGQYGTIGGGSHNCTGVSNNYSTVAGGQNNSVTGSSGVASSILGGMNNKIEGPYSSILGGCDNKINSTQSECNVIAGGANNTINNSDRSFVFGSSNSITTTNFATAIGVSNIITGSTVVSVLGGTNRLEDSVYGAIGGGLQNSGSADYITIGGGRENQIKRVGTCQPDYSTIAGGSGNCIRYDSYSTIGGGMNNSIAGIGCGNHNVIAGGNSNINSGKEGFIGAGRSNEISYLTVGSSIVAGKDNTNSGTYAFIGGGNSNEVTKGGCSTGGCYSSVVGGSGNTITQSHWSGIVGGKSNSIQSDAPYSFIGGGADNIVNTGVQYSAILGGEANVMRHGNSFIIGTGITSSATNYTFVNNLCNVGGGTSDCRLKENVVGIPYGLSQVAQLDPVAFNFIDDESKKVKYGFLAQCVQEVMPEIIYNHPTQTVDGDSVLQFDKDAIWASTINAIKELKSEVEALKDEISILKQK